MKHITFLLIIFMYTLSMQGCSQKSSRVSQVKKNTSTPSFIIDDHLHYGATDKWEKSFLDVYSRHNAMACLLVRMDDLKRGIAFAKAHPDRIIPYASIDIDSPTVLKDIKKVHDMGYIGLGELFALNFGNYDDKKYEPIWSLAEKLNMQLLFHTGIHASGNFARMRPSYLASIAQRHPDLIIVGAHLGNPWYAEAAEGVRQNDYGNLHFDITGSSLIKKSKNPGFWKHILWWTPYLNKPHVGGGKQGIVRPAYESIVFGTDQDPDAFEENIIRFNKMLDAANIPDSTRAKMYGLTMARLLGISDERIARAKGK